MSLLSTIIPDIVEQNLYFFGTAYIYLVAFINSYINTIMSKCQRFVTVSALRQRNINFKFFKFN